MGHGRVWIWFLVVLAATGGCQMSENEELRGRVAELESQLAKNGKPDREDPSTHDSHEDVPTSPNSPSDGPGPVTRQHLSLLRTAAIESCMEARTQNKVFRVCAQADHSDPRTRCYCSFITPKGFRKYCERSVEQAHGNCARVAQHSGTCTPSIATIDRLVDRCADASFSYATCMAGHFERTAAGAAESHAVDVCGLRLGP
jgi:hypothetical protein